jgi:RNA polymerase sigma factor (sigma-70 family)
MSPSVPLCLLQTQSDARLVELARGGHERAFEALIQRYRKPLLSYCRRLLLPEARAEDALQQGLLQAWLALRDDSDVRDVKAWLYRIVHNAAISAMRRSGYDYVQLDESLHGGRAPESDIDRRIAVREALAGLAALPETQREALLLTAVQGHSHEQVAAAMGLSGGAVRGLIYRARATLRTAATAFTPPQIALWAAQAGESGSVHAQIAEIAGGGGSAGLLGLMFKSGAVVVSAGALATGAAIVEHKGGSTSNAQAAPSASLGRHRTLEPAPSSDDPSVGLTFTESASLQPSIIANHGRGSGNQPFRSHRSERGRHDPALVPDHSHDAGLGLGTGVAHDGSPGGGPAPSGSPHNDGSGGDHRSAGSGNDGPGGGSGPSSPGSEGSGDGHGSGAGENGDPSQGSGPSGSDGGDGHGIQLSGAGPGEVNPSPVVSSGAGSGSSGPGPATGGGANEPRESSTPGSHGGGDSSSSEPSEPGR